MPPKKQDEKKPTVKDEAEEGEEKPTSERRLADAVRDAKIAALKVCLLCRVTMWKADTTITSPVMSAESTVAGPCCVHNTVLTTSAVDAGHGPVKVVRKQRAAVFVGTCGQLRELHADHHKGSTLRRTSKTAKRTPRCRRSCWPTAAGSCRC